MTFIKVCGITRAEDAQRAVAHGATALGFIFWPKSPRCIDASAAAEIIRALPPSVTTVGVFVNQPPGEIARISAQARVSMLQLHGEEAPGHADAAGLPVMKATSLAAADATLRTWPGDTLILLDAHDPARRGGTGATIDWKEAAAIAARRHVVLAGGLTPENVRDAIAAVHPYGIDVSSGVEEAPGVKSLDKMKRFLENVRMATHG